jgi:thioredoxin reductase (NADPH)
MEIYDLIIIGAGPAGLTASIYASCYHLKNLVIGAQIGGQLQFAPDILNYPGFVEVTGKELTHRMVDQLKARGGKLVTQSVTKISNFQFPCLAGRQAISNKNPNSNSNDINKNGFEIETLDGMKYQTKAIILATGMERRKLNVPGEAEYTGRGVYYCATCEKQDYEGKICVVVGGGNSATQGAVELAQAAKKVYLIYRGTQLRGDAVWIEKIKKSKVVEVLYDTVVKEILGDGKKVTEVIISNDKLEIDKIFIEIGGVPGTALVIPLGVETDEGGYIRVNSKLETNIPGIIAAGDMVRFGFSIEQISSAVGLGARAAASAFAYLTCGKTPSIWGTAQKDRNLKSKNQFSVSFIFVQNSSEISVRE